MLLGRYRNDLIEVYTYSNLMNANPLCHWIVDDSVIMTMSAVVIITRDQHGTTTTMIKPTHNDFCGSTASGVKIALLLK